MWYGCSRPLFVNFLSWIVCRPPSPNSSSEPKSSSVPTHTIVFFQRRGGWTDVFCFIPDPGNPGQPEVPLFYFRLQLFFDLSMSNHCMLFFTTPHSAVGGFALQQISNCTKDSSVECEYLCQASLKRLAHQSADVKVKVLQIVKYVCANGRDEFRIILQRNCQLIKDHLRKYLNCPVFFLSLASLS